MAEQPALFWGLVASMWIGNLFLLVINLPLIGIWVKMISVPYQSAVSGDPRVLRALASSACRTPVRHSILMALFGIVGYAFRKLGCEPAPMMLGFILGPMIEEYLRRALLMKNGSAMVFVTRPISATLLAISVIALVIVLLPALRTKREEAFQK